MTDLSVRILARVAQLEALARAADEEDVADSGVIMNFTSAHTEHIHAFDPAFVLNHLAPGARQLVELHQADEYEEDYCASCGDVPQVPYPCDTLQAVARMVGVAPA